MFCRELLAVCSETHAQYINTLGMCVYVCVRVRVCVCVCVCVWGVQFLTPSHLARCYVQLPL